MKCNAAALSLAAWYTRDPLSLERIFQHLTPTSLEQLGKGIHPKHEHEYEHVNLSSLCHEVTTYRVFAQAAIRRIAHKQLDKYKDSSITTRYQVEAALKYYTLPYALQEELWNNYGGSTPPATWWEALERLQELSEGDSIALWRLILDHPMTAYVPMQCQNCGHVVPDASSERDDIDIGLSEVDPMVGEDLLEIRGGWFRGRPRAAKILQLDCPDCRSVTRWYRSSHPQIILNPNKWGRLCGEQEDLRLALAKCLGIQLRTCIPLDWDHVWSEYGTSTLKGVSPPGSIDWQVQDDSAKNFAVRLDEGIGAWTGILGIHPNPTLCQDLTSEYLQCRKTSANGEVFSHSGRAEVVHSAEMSRYSKIVKNARLDESGATTQAKTMVGHLLQQAGMTADDVTNELKRAALDYGKKGWWEVYS